MDEREVDAGLGHQAARVLELVARTGRARPAGRPGRASPIDHCAAPQSELEDVAARDVARDAQLGLGAWDVPHASPAAVGQLGAVARW